MIRALLACIALAGCADPITEAVVVTDSDLPVPERLDEIRWVVDASAVSGQVEARSLRLTEGAELPVVLPIVHRGGAFGPITVTAEGLHAGVTVVRRTARFTFVRGRSIVVSLDLTSECAGVTCAEGETCVGGACVDPSIAPDAGAPADAGVPDARPAPDAGTDAGPPPPVDSGSACSPTCACEQSCVGSVCECLAGCGCHLSCVGDDVECNEGKCDGAGTTCRVTARGADEFRTKCEHQASCTMDLDSVSNIQVQCRSESTCDIACTDVSNCEVECSGGAACLVTCTRTSTCTFTVCDGANTVCPGGQIVCNRPCP